MIKLASNKIGSIHLDEKYLLSIMKKLILDVVDEKDLIKIDLDIKKNNIKKIEVFFKKSCNIEIIEQKNLYNQIEFTVSMHFGISNNLIIFSYEN